MKFKDVGELKNKSLSFDEAEYRDVFVDRKQLAEGYRCVWNTTQNNLVCIRKTNRVLIKHRDLIDEFFNVSSDLNLGFEGVYREQGNKISIFSYIRDGKDVKEGVKLGIVLNNDYKAGASVGLYGFRVQCENGMVLTQQAKKTFNLQNLGELNGAMKSCINGLMQEDKKLSEIINLAIKDSIEYQLAGQILDLLIYGKKHKAGIKDVLIEITKNKKDKVSRWELYNAITQFCTHGENLKPAVQDYLQRQAQKVLMETKFNAIKTQIAQ